MTTVEIELDDDVIAQSADIRMSLEALVNYGHDDEETRGALEIVAAVDEATAEPDELVK